MPELGFGLVKFLEIWLGESFLIYPSFPKAAPGRLDLLPMVIGDQAAIPIQVLQEYDNGVTKGILPRVTWEWLEVVDMTSAEQRLFNQHLSQVNAGEAACLAIVAARNGLVFTDDRDARKLAARLKIPVSGTIGILVRLHTLKMITLSEANQLLDQMIEIGYRSPIPKLEDL